MNDATPDDNTLLRDYAEKCSSESFTLLVQRHVNSVFSSALRRANGDRAMAEDITQQVFTDFARKAPGLPAGTVPGGWLHRHTGFVASHYIDRERRRRAREQQAAAMNALTDHTDAAAWEHTAPLLDEALDALPATDRDAIVLRFFEKRDFRAVGHALGVSDDTAQKRVTRALDKLRGLLTRRGVTSTGTVLSAILLANSVTPAPAALTASVATRSLAGAAMSGGTLAGAVSGMNAAARWKLAGLAALVAAAGAAPLVVWNWREKPAAAAVPSAAIVPPPPPAPEKPPEPPPPPVAATASQTLDEIIAAAAREFRGGAQNVGAVSRGLTLLTTIPASDALKALDVIKNVPDQSARALLFKYYLSYWAEKEPWKALDYAMNKLPKEHRLATSEGVLAAWAARDPDAVFGWHEKGRGMAPPPVRDSLLAVLFKTLASKDLPKAFGYLGVVDNLNDRAQALRGILDTVQTTEDRERVLYAVSKNNDAELRTQTRRAVVENWARQDPGAAAAWVDKAEPAWERPQLRDSLGLTWLQSEPEKAAAWWIACEPGPDTMVKIINVWSQKDVTGASKWLDTQPLGPQSDTARMTFARQVAPGEPDRALIWAATVSDETMRENTINHIYQNWLQRDPAAANAFLKQSGWPADRITRLQQP